MEEYRKVFLYLTAEWFYAVLTLHGVGMVGLWFVAGMAAVTYLLARYIRPPLWASWMGLGGTLVGFAFLIVATSRGMFGTGWYFLYPLPFYSQGTWPPWATGCFFASLVTLSSIWLVWSLAMIGAILKRYPLRYALGWHYLSGQAGKQGRKFLRLSSSPSLLSSQAWRALRMRSPFSRFTLSSGR